MIYPSSFEKKVGFDLVREAVKAKCMSAMAVEKCAAMSFSSDYLHICERLEGVGEMLALINEGHEVPLHNITDVSGLLQHISVVGTYLSAGEVVTLRKSLTGISEIYDFFVKRCLDSDGTVARYKRLWDIVGSMITFVPVIRAIDRIIDVYGNVKDSASPELGQIRRQLASLSGRVNSVMRRVIASAVRDGVLEADVTATMRDGRLVVPVAPMNKRRINGIVHDESASGKTVFIEPAEVVEVNNQIRELEMDERREIIKILSALADEIRPHTADMIDSSERVGEVDFINAKARYAAEVGGQLPSISSKPVVQWYHACHPILLSTLRRQGKDIVPLDIELTSQRRILVISGPNAGGKSVCLKTVGVVQYMMQCGLLPPLYENSRMGVFRDIFVDIGDDQSLEDDLSTYSSHLKNMRLFLQRGSSVSLMLIDEFGTGTEPQIGGALAQAILHHLNDKKMWGVITTHYQNLKHYAEETSGLVNGSMLYDRHLMQPIFKLSIGHPGSSFAVEIARKTGLPVSIIEEAESIVGQDYINMDRYLLDIARDRKYWAEKRATIKQKEKKLESTLQNYEHDAEELRDKRREILADAQAQAKKIIEESNAAVERTIRDIREAQAEKERTKEARRKLTEQKRDMLKNRHTDMPDVLKRAPKVKKQKSEKEHLPVKESDIKVGDVVKLDGEGVAGKVTDVNGKNATVTFGMIKTVVALSRLRHTMSKVETGVSRGATFISEATSRDMRERQLNFKQEIDVRGMRVDEAVQAVTYFIDDAIQCAVSRVRILHGTGTGALRQSIRNYLSTIDGVKSYHDEHVQLGGAGITVVEL
ncbi:MAG: Smr/MutS family protein [Paramuribaculum sp.]|nr:Smr/MutS family protein [Paramuribaculum sp.]